MESKISGYYIFTLIIGILLCVGLSIYGIYTSLIDIYWSIYTILFVTVLLIIISIIIYKYLHIKKYILGDDKIEIYRLNNRPIGHISYSLITSIEEIEKAGRSKYDSQFILVINTKENQIKLNKKIYANYEKIKETIVQKTTLPLSIKHGKQVKIHVVLLIIGFCLFAIGIINFISPSITYSRDNTSKIWVLQEGKPQLNIVRSGRSSYKNIVVKSSLFPKFNFTLDYPVYEASNQTIYLDSIKDGDSLEIIIPKEDYEVKLLKTKEGDFADKHAGYYTIPILGLRSKKEVVLTLNEYNITTINSSGENKFIFILIGGIFICIGLLVWYNHKNNLS